jgi:hypothetical protein
VEMKFVYVNSFDRGALIIKRFEALNILIAIGVCKDNRMKWKRSNIKELGEIEVSKFFHFMSLSCIHNSNEETNEFLYWE